MEFGVQKSKLSMLKALNKLPKISVRMLVNAKV